MFDQRIRLLYKVDQKTKSLWDGITADIMTEEESEEDKGFVRHHQLW